MWKQLPQKKRTFARNKSIGGLRDERKDELLQLSSATISKSGKKLPSDTVDENLERFIRNRS